MRIRLFATLRPPVGGKFVEIPAEEGEPVGEVIRRLVELHPALQGEILTPDGQALQPHVQVFIAGRSIRDQQGLETRLPPGVDLAIFPPVAGG